MSSDPDSTCDKKRAQNLLYASLYGERYVSEIVRIFEHTVGAHAISFDGGIGCGKTTLVNFLASCSDQAARSRHIHLETAHRNGTLESYLDSPHELAGMFQQWMFAECLMRSRMMDMLHDQAVSRRETVLQFLDRTLVGNRCFAIANTVQGFMRPKELRFYECASKGVADRPFGCSVNIVLYARPITCMRRMHVRGDPEEVSGYLEKLEYFRLLDQCLFLGVLGNLAHALDSSKRLPQWVVFWDSDCAATSQRECDEEPVCEHDIVGDTVDENDNIEEITIVTGTATATATESIECDSMSTFVSLLKRILSTDDKSTCLGTQVLFESVERIDDDQFNLYHIVNDKELSCGFEECTVNVEKSLPVLLFVDDSRRVLDVYQQLELLNFEDLPKSVNMALVHIRGGVEQLISDEYRHAIMTVLATHPLQLRIFLHTKDKEVHFFNGAYRLTLNSKVIE